jgi:DNA-binding protein HU-beta
VFLKFLYKFKVFNLKGFAMNKTQIIDAVSSYANLNGAQSSRTVNAIIKAIQDKLAEGEAVNLIGFGSFEVKPRAARVGRNPKTGEPITLPAGKKVSFKASNFFRDQLG